MKRFVSVMIFAVCLTAVSIVPARAVSGRPEELLTLLEQMEGGYARVRDYTATFFKQERVGGKLQERETIHLKFMKPFKVYMKWIGNVAKEALYVKGDYNDKVLARADGLLGLVTWSFNPRDARLMEGNRHSITEIGFGFIIEMMRRDVPKALELGELTAPVAAADQFDGKPVTRVEFSFKPAEGRSYYAGRIVLHVDEEHRLPVGVTCYDAAGQLLEQYAYKDLKVNIGLTPDDFSKGNKSYRF